MKTIKSNFTENDDYKIMLFHTEKRKNEGGFNKEDVMLNTDTFKNLCMIAKTPQGKEIRKYYMKLENIHNKIIREEIEQQKSIQEQMKKQLEETKEQLTIKEEQLQIQEKTIEEKDQTIEQLINKPTTMGFHRKNGNLYLDKDKSAPGHYKIGFTCDPEARLAALNTASSRKSLEIVLKYTTIDMEFAEKIIHYALNPWKIQGRKEWFYFSNDFELGYAINTIKSCINYVKKYNFTNYKEFESANVDLDINKELDEINKEKEYKEKENKYRDEVVKNQKMNLKTRNIKNHQQSGPRTGTFKGACWVEEKQQWAAQLQNNYKNEFLGYYTNEIDAAQVYNDYAAFLNKTTNTDFKLNDIPGYKTVPRNVPEENKIIKQNNKSSKYTGVSYDKKRKFYVAGITMSGKSFVLGNSENEDECAKLYNQQALYFNNKIGTKYVLNEIENYITLPRDICTEISEKVKSKKTSKYYGVSLTTTKKWACSYMMNRKKIHIGTFNTELEAVEAYNKVVIELNKSGCNYKINIF